MSEFQYYEFRTVNRALTREEQKVVDTWSSRGQVTSVSASFEYHYSDFRQDAKKCLEGYFDMMLYVANWGSKRTMFRLPAHLADFKALKAYRWGEQFSERRISISKSKKYIIIDIEEHLEEGYEDWVEGEGVLAGFAPLWNDLIAGDYAVLYLTWLDFARYSQEIMDGEGNDEDMETPPVPVGLKKASAALEAYMDFWGISNDLRSAAVGFSAENTSISPQKLEENIQKLSEKEKDTFLLRLFRDEPHLRTTLLKRLEEMEPVLQAKPSKKPTLQAILDAQSEARTNRMRREQEEAARKRRMELEQLEKRADKAWRDIHSHLQLKIASGYNQAVNDLKDLRDLAEMRNTLPIFKEKMQAILAEYGRSQAFIRRLQESKLI